MAWFFTRRSSSHGHHKDSSSSSYKPSYARSTSSLFSTRSHSSSTSHYKRRPRSGYIDRLLHKFKHLLRELWYYLRRNPIKVFFLVIMPLVSGGALAAFARQFGVKLPDFLSGKGARDMQGAYDGYYGSRGYADDGSGGVGGLLGGENVGNLMKVAKMFL